MSIFCLAVNEKFYLKSLLLSIRVISLLAFIVTIFLFPKKLKPT